MTNHEGMHFVQEALRLEDFPIDIEGINYAVGDLDVFRPGGEHCAVRRLTDRLPQQSYASADEVVGALRKILADPQFKPSIEAA